LKYALNILFSFALRSIFLVVIAFLSTLQGHSQTEEQLQFRFEKDTIAVAMGESFINFVTLQNLGNSDITIEDFRPQKPYPGLLLSVKPAFILSKGEKKRLPIKFLVNTDFMKMKSNEITFQLSYSINGGKNTLKASFFIERNEEKQIALYSFPRETYLNPAQPESTISLYVENRGYSSRSIKLNFQTVPDGLEVKNKEIILSLEGQEKKLVEFQVSVRHQKNFYPDYNINVKATDLTNNEIVGNAYLKLIVLSNNRQITRGPGLEMGKNFAEMAYIQQSSGFDYFQFRGNTEFSAAKDVQARLNLTTDYFHSEDQYNIYDTWLELERKNSLLRLGNIYGNDYDYSISGRGGLFKTELTENKAIEVFAMDNNYNLFGTYFPESEGSKIAGAKYSFRNLSDFNGKVSYIFDHNPRLQTDTQVANFVSTVLMDSIHKFLFDAGLSHERAQLSNDQNTGVSAGLNYETRIGNLDIQSINDIGSKSYAGLNRGYLNFSQNIGYKTSQQSRLFLQYQNSQINPEYLSLNENPEFRGQAYYQYSFFSTHSLKLGTQFSLANWNFMFSPQVEKQKSNTYSFQNELLSYRFRMNIGTAFNGHGIDVSAEYSYSKTSEIPWFHSFRTTLSYRFGGFSLNGSAQFNPDDVIDLNYYNSQTKNFINFNAFIAYNFHTHNNIFIGSVSGGINNSQLYNNMNKTVNGNIEYKFSRSFAATAYGNYSDYESTQNYGYKGRNYQLRIGVKKYFIKATASGNSKISLQLFHDRNFNGIFDLDETPIAFETVLLNEYVAITDKNGKVNFQNVPSGTYTIKFNEISGLRMAMDPVIVVNGNQSLQIGLIKKNRVVGKLKELKQTYDTQESFVRGVIVYARDNNGTVSSTVVDQNDTFEFFLGNGTYSIYIENTKYEYLNPIQNVTLQGSDISEPLIFEYKKKNTEIKVKRF